MKKRIYTPEEVQNATNYVMEQFENKQITIGEWNVYVNMMTNIERAWNQYPMKIQAQFIYTMEKFEQFLDTVEYKFEIQNYLKKISTLN
jgi:hypothetical protein